MPGGNERKVFAGDRLNIQASTFNDLIDMLRQHKRNKFSVGGESIFDRIKPNHVILVRNATGGSLTSSYKILRLSGTLTDVDSDRYGYGKRPSFDGYTPTSTDNAFCVTQVPLTSSSSGTNIGKAVIGGITVCKVSLTDTSHGYANPLPGVTDYLGSASTGQARILWYGESSDDGDTEADIYLAVVNLIGSKIDLETAGEDTDVVTGICPIFQDVTYQDALDELFDLLKLAPGYAEGKVLSSNSSGLLWIDN